MSADCVTARIDAAESRAQAGETPSRSVTLSFGAAEAAGLCSLAGVGVASIAVRDGGGCTILCRTAAGADELRLRFAGHLLTEPTR